MPGTFHGGGLPPHQPTRDPLRPRVISAASVLLIVSGLLWAPVMGQDAAVERIAGVLLLAHITFAVRVRRPGRTKARTGATVMTVLLLFCTVPYVWLGFLDPGHLYGPGNAVLDMVAVAACCTGAVLLYLPAARSHFRRP